MTAVHDALVALTERRSHADARAMLDELTEREKLTMEAVTYLRGRSLHGTYVLVDEAQNLEPTTLKTILTRSARAPRSCSPATPARSTRPTSPSTTTRCRC